MRFSTLIVLILILIMNKFQQSREWIEKRNAQNGGGAPFNGFGVQQGHGQHGGVGSAFSGAVNGMNLCGGDEVQKAIMAMSALQIGVPSQGGYRPNKVEVEITLRDSGKKIVSISGNQAVDM